MTAARSGHAEAYGELYRRHVGAARTAALALTHHQMDADDITSEAFARVLQAARAGGGPNLCFRSYLVSAVRNVFYDRLRRIRELPIANIADELVLAMPDPVDDTEDPVATNALASLPTRWQEVLWLREVEGRSSTEIGPLMNLAPSAVAALAYRAREGLRHAIPDQRPSVS